jgi:hypothetical protein
MRPRLWAFALGVLLACAGCKREAPPAPAAAQGPNARTYAMRGVVKAIGAPSPSGQRQLTVQHEAVPDFTDEFGKTVGMDTMVMPFQLAPAVRTDGLQPGDKIAFTLSVDWSQPRIEIVALSRLPPQTELKFGPAHPTAKP